MNLDSKYALFDVSRETSGAIEAFLELLGKWNRRVRLVGDADLSTLWDSHVADSLALGAALVPSVKTWVDLGSGGGFPVVILAFLAKDRGLDTRFLAIESDRRKAAFLAEASRQFNLAVDVYAERIESVGPLEADVVSAKALADVRKLLGLSSGLSRSARLVFPKGPQVHSEIDQCCDFSRVRYYLKYHRGSRGGYILMVEEYSIA